MLLCSVKRGLVLSWEMGSSITEFFLWLLIDFFCQLQSIQLSEGQVDLMNVLPLPVPCRVYTVHCIRTLCKHNALRCWLHWWWHTQQCIGIGHSRACVYNALVFRTFVECNQLHTQYTRQWLILPQNFFPFNLRSTDIRFSVQKPVILVESPTTFRWKYEDKQTRPVNLWWVQIRTKL